MMDSDVLRQTEIKAIEDAYVEELAGIFKTVWSDPGTENDPDSTPEARFQNGLKMLREFRLLSLRIVQEKYKCKSTL